MKTITLIFITLIMYINCLTGSDRNFVIGVQNFQYYLPYSQYKNNEFIGFERELLDLFAEKYNYTFEYRALPLKRLYSDFLNENVDFKMPDNPLWVADEKKDKGVIYSDGIVSYVDGVIVLSERSGDSPEDIRKIGLPFGYTPAPSYSELLDNGKVVFIKIPNLERLLIELINKRIDGVYINIAVANYYFNKMFKNEDVIFYKDLPYVKNTRHFSTILHPEIINEFNEFLFKENETIKLIKDKYDVEIDFILK